MFEIDFSGWFQVRLATDPDQYLEKRGVNGWTFAFAGEPDLDRVIRFQSPVAPRSHAPLVGVRVTAVRVDDQVVSAHPLIGAAVELLDNPVFEGRSDGTTPGVASPGFEPIVPFHLRIRQQGITVEATDVIDISNLSEVTRLGGQGNQPPAPQDFKNAAGVTTPQAWRRQRKAQVDTDLAGVIDPVQQQALGQRSHELGLGGIRVASLTFYVHYAFSPHGPNTLTDPTSAMGSVPFGAAWTLDFHMGCFDADALQGFVLGNVSTG